MWQTGSFVEDKSSAGHFSADHYSDKPERVPIGKGQFKTILRKHATQYLPSIEIFKPATWEAIFTEVRELFDTSPKGGSRKRVRRRHDSHASSDAVDVEDTILLVSDTDSEPDGGTTDDNDAPDDNDKDDLVDDTNKMDVDDAGDENRPYDDQCDGGDDISEGGGAGDGVEADLESIHG
jgi:hypothetical protein